MNKGLIAGILLVAGAAVVWMIGASQKQAPESAPPAARSEGVKAKPEVKSQKPPPPPPKDPWKEALDIAASGSLEAVTKLAAKWRAQARDDAAFLRRLIEAVKDPATPFEAREIAAFVIGSLQNKEGLIALADALEKAEPGWAKTLLLALGSQKQSEDDDIFGLPDSPRVIRTPIGLTVEIRGRVIDDEVRTRMLTRLLAISPGEVRWAAALALGDSTDYEDVRQSFVTALAIEADPAAQGELAKALSTWAAGQSEEASDRRAVVGALFDGAKRVDAAALRLRSEDGLKRMTWTVAEIQSVAPSIEAGPFDQRRWAMAVLSGAAARADTPARNEIFKSLEWVAMSDTDAKMRELAVTSLSSFPENPRTQAVLIARLADGAWHVRAAAVRAMGRGTGGEPALNALKKTRADDPDERVRRAAAEVLKVLTSK